MVKFEKQYMYLMNNTHDANKSSTETHSGKNKVRVYLIR